MTLPNNNANRCIRRGILFSLWKLSTVFWRREREHICMRHLQKERKERDNSQMKSDKEGQVPKN